MTSEPQETGNDASSTPDSDTDTESTVEVPLSAFDTPPAVGDTISLKVISVDTESGVINAQPMDNDADDEGGSDSLAADFDDTKTQ